MTKCQVCKCLIKNCKCPGTEHLCKTCRERESLGEHEACTCCLSCGGSKIDNSCSCCSACSRSQQACNCCKVCGKPVDSCPGCCDTCKKVQCECVCPHCQQHNCECCSDCRNYPCTCGQHCRQCQKEEINCVCCPTCRQPQCNCCKTCSKPDCGVCCTRCLQRKTSCDCCQKCQAIKADCDCPPKVQVPAKTSQPPTSSTMSSIEPPDMSILKDRSQLEFYTSALERWATIAKASGVAETLLADIVLAHAFKQAPELCKEMSDHSVGLAK